MPQGTTGRSRGVFSILDAVILPVRAWPDRVAARPGRAAITKRRENQPLASAFSTCFRLWEACAAVLATWLIVFS